ncbi:threonine aldolase family protein [Pseudomonas mosselii]|uniref:Aminotransferase class I/II-fold pyridoxal phosphate-dependent enzyme n=1 Tax=Pseudomonas mosselii TaxID=78327 RepID=A0AA42RWA3_9PSED|nr:GntG family PLP-dependent aldolase [Pseudomonas mosselii]MDH1631404.1 aminotransferase class I/II-fold pyridoxal phosphate-dependent enzyme [Pseudomonas mosselii]
MFIDLRSDTVTKPTEGMRKAIYEAEVGDDCFGEDPSVRALEEYCAHYFQKEAALFTTGGTLSNQLAIKAMTRPGDEIFLDASYHINFYEAASTSAFSGVNFSLTRHDDGLFDVADLERLYASKCRWNQNYAMPRVVVVENTLGCKGGAVFPLEQMNRVFSYAKQIDAYRYLDGARILHASIATGIDVTSYTDNADLLSMCLSKGLGAPVGSIMMGSRELIQQVRKYRKWFGGDQHQAGMMAAAGLYAMRNNIERLAEDHEHAALLHEQFGAVEEARSGYKGTNMVTLDISRLGVTPMQFAERLRERGVGGLPYNDKEIRLVPHINIDRAQVIKAAELIKSLVRDLAHATEAVK